MKGLIRIFISFLIVSTCLWAQNWSEVLTPDIKVSLSDICMTSVNNVWLVGEEGHIYYTTDGFATLQSTVLDTDADLKKVFFVDENNGWIGSEDGTIYITNDKGNNWNSISLGTVMSEGFTFKYFDGLYFVNDTVGFALAGKYKYNYLYKTTDGGLTWAIKDSIADGVSSSRWADIKFYGENKGVVAGNKTGTLRYTADGGETWVPGDSSVFSAYQGSGAGAVSWADENTVIYIGSGMSYSFITIPIYKSTDGGVTWESKSSSIEGNYDRPEEIYFKDSQNGIAVGSNGFNKMSILKTTDGGENWVSSVGIYNLGFSALTGSGNILYALCTSSHILKSEDFGETWELFYIKSPSLIRAIQVTDSKAYALNSYSDFYVSQDGSGSSWEFISNAGVWDAEDIYFLSNSEGVAIKENRTILKTTDGGSSWSYVLDPVDFASANTAAGVSFGDDQTGYALFSIGTYADYSVYKTTDKGSTWSEAAQIEGPGYFSGGIEFFDASNGFIAGPHEKPDTVYVSWIMYTEDGGTAWNRATVQGLPDELEYDSFEDVAKVNDNTAYAVGGSNIFKTTDKGKTWNYIDHGLDIPDTNFRCISFSGDYGILANYYGEIFLTEDGGNTWTLHNDYYNVYTPSTVTITDEGDALVGAYDGYILAYQAVTGVEDGEELLNNYSLSQNYPNPFNPSTTIKYSIPEAGIVKVTVYNMLGQKVQDVLNTFHNAGNHEVVIDGSELSSGVYFYQLTAGSYQTTKKMLLLK
ncbi:MAG: YCF48-related protein [Ignavibacteria bacterium]